MSAVAEDGTRDPSSVDFRLAGRVVDDIEAVQEIGIPSGWTDIWGAEWRHDRFLLLFHNGTPLEDLRRGRQGNSPYEAGRIPHRARKGSNPWMWDPRAFSPGEY